MRKSILAGILIGLGGFAFLSVDNKYLGSFLFSVGLLGVLLLEANLYTGWVCKKESYYTTMLPVVFIFNVIGAQIVGILSSETVRSAALVVCNNKMDNSLLHWFIASIFCGIFIGIAVRSWGKIHSELIVVLCVMGFILTGSEHVIADVYYFEAAQLFSMDIVIRIIITAIGNTLGGASMIWMLKEDSQ